MQAAVATILPVMITGCGASDSTRSATDSAEVVSTVPDTVYVTETIVEQVEAPAAPAEPSDAERMGFNGPVKKASQDYWEGGDSFFFDPDGNLTRYEGYAEAYSCVVYFSDGVPVSGLENEDGDYPNHKMSKADLKEYREVTRTKLKKGPGMKKDKYGNWVGGKDPYSGMPEDGNFIRKITYY